MSETREHAKADELSVTPRTSRIGSRLSHTHSGNKYEGRSLSSRITTFFPVRKQLKRVFNACKDDDCSDIGKRQKRGNTIVGAKFKSPVEKYPETPVATEYFSEDEASTENGVMLCCESLTNALPSALGIFDQLPPSLFLTVIEKLSVPRLVTLSLSSHEWSDRIVAYMGTESYRNRLTREYREFLSNRSLPYTSRDPFHTFGELLKATSVCQSTAVRISKLVTFIEKCSDTVNDFQGWGRFIHTICTKWAFTECAKVVRAVLRMDNCKIEKLIRQMIIAPYGSDSRLEMKVRRMLRGLFLDSIMIAEKLSDHGVEKEKSFWLSALLRTQLSANHQGRLFLVLFNSLEKNDNGSEFINWRSLVDIAVTSWSDAEERLKPMADALYTLLKTRKLKDGLFGWNENEVFNMIEEITTFPEPWSFDNFVMLLTHRPYLIPISVCARIRHGYDDEAGSIVNSIKVLLYRWGIDIQSILRVPLMYCMNTMNLEQRRQLYKSIYAAHVRQFHEYLAHSDTRAGLGNLQLEINSHAALTPVLSEMSSLLSQ
ncbi:unnamed protein product [Auanema sp. JU1783]|nr:unnamed protein product [Auanema sp. JU1783]